MNFLKSLHSPPDGTDELASLIHRLDQCFLSGFARLDTGHKETLASLTRVFTGTPLENPLQKSCDAIQRNEFLEEHFAAIASVRAALHGTYYDILHKHVTATLGRSPVEIPESEDIGGNGMPSHIGAWMESARHWLTELAIAGFGRAEIETVMPFMSSLEQIQKEPRLVRQSALLTGLFDELLRALPVSDVNALPLCRWTDLWTRSMIGTLRLFPPLPAKRVSGLLRLMGFDVRQHSHFVSVLAYGMLKLDDFNKFVRITLSSYKVDAIAGDEIWLLFPNAVSLFRAFSEKAGLHIKNMPILPTGDLIWNGDAVFGEKYKLADQAGRWFTPDAGNTIQLCRIHPADRHPVHLAEPVFLDDYAVKKTDDRIVLDWGENLVLPVAMEQISPVSELTEDMIVRSVRMFGLLRFDAGQWALHPLGVVYEKGRGKARKTYEVFTGGNAAAIIKKISGKSTVAMLQERAGRLLRG
ncbi:hypothetical protein QUF80_00790 [Desulfococcaceae bacterium HSG8]|nr:hypothetical protein [Desulfococcaceae bacterium HSG8]